MEVEAYKSRLLCVLFKYQSNTYIPYRLHAGCCYISSTSSMRESKLGASAVPAGELTYTCWINFPSKLNATSIITSYYYIRFVLLKFIDLIAKQHPTQVQLKVLQKE